LPGPKTQLERQISFRFGSYFCRDDFAWAFGFKRLKLRIRLHVPCLFGSNGRDCVLGTYFAFLVGIRIRISIPIPIRIHMTRNFQGTSIFSLLSSYSIIITPPWTRPGRRIGDRAGQKSFTWRRARHLPGLSVRFLVLCQCSCQQALPLVWFLGSIKSFLWAMHSCVL